MPRYPAYPRLATGIVAPIAGLGARLATAGENLAQRAEPFANPPPPSDPEAASQAAQAWVNQHFGHNTTTPVGQAIGRTVSGALAPVGNAMNAAGGAIERGGTALGIPQSETQAGLHELGEIANVAPVVGAVGQGIQGGQRSH